jgi:hypothetical protein
LIDSLLFNLQWQIFHAYSRQEQVQQYINLYRNDVWQGKKLTVAIAAKISIGLPILHVAIT